jgi:hypothetical protein
VTVSAATDSSLCEGEWTGLLPWCFHSRMGDVDRLNKHERSACVIAERTLGVVAEAWDVDGREGVVDAMLTFPDGRRAAFEVTCVRRCRLASNRGGRCGWELALARLTTPRSASAVI